MALIIDLKPDEKVIVGNSVITNDKHRTRLRIDGDAPILREKDTLTEVEANTPSKKLYFTLQSMYLNNATDALSGLDYYFNYMSQIRTLAPHISNFLNDVSANILQGQYYKGMKLVQDLMNAEETGEEPRAKTAKSSVSPQVEAEASMITQAANQLQDLYDNWDTTPEKDRDNTISYNRKLWMAFFDGVGDKTRQTSGEEFDVLSNIINLYNYIYKRSTDIITNGDKDKLNSLININHEVATAMRRG